MTTLISPLPGARARITSEKGKVFMIFPRTQPQPEPKTYFSKFIDSDSPPQQQDVVSNRKTTVVPRPEPLRQSFRASTNAFSRDPNPNGILEFNYGESCNTYKVFFCIWCYHMHIFCEAKQFCVC